MQSKKKLLKNSKLYLILDAGVNSYKELFELVKKSVAYGVDVIQLRDKTSKAKDVLEFSISIKKYVKDQIVFIINDRLDMALASGADGVHVGQEDLPLLTVKKIVKKDFIVGVSCQTFEHACEAERNGADYIGFGSVFKTLTKPERVPMNQEVLKRVVNKIKIPVFPIGGIDLNNAEVICRLGVKRLAVCRSLSLSKNFVKDVRSFKNLLTH